MDKVIFTVGYGMTRVTCPAEHRRISEFIRKTATITYDGYTRDKSGRGRQRQFYMSLYRDSCFPSGLLDKILPELDPDQYLVIDQRQKPARDSRMVFDPDMYDKLWQHQKEAFHAAKQWSRCIFKEPTGSGKTNLAAAIINAAGVKTLYVVPTKNLLYQTYREFCQTFGRQNVGLIGDGQWSAYQPIVVATVQSLWQRYDDLVEFNRSFDDVKMLILDEAHHCNTTTRTMINKSGKEVKIQDRNTWFKIANRVPAYYRFGLTATPGDPGDESRSLLEAVTGLIRHESNTMELVEQGILVKPKPIFYRVRHPRRYKVWRVAKETGLSGNAVRNRMIAEIALQYSLKGKLVLVVVDRVETHGRVLYDLIGSRHSLFVYGDDTTETRESAKRLFESGSIRILIGTIYGEGVNMPKVDVVINAAGGKSKKVAIQRFGRALRRSTGKSEGILIDFMDEDRGVLLEHSIERFDVYEGEGYGPVVQDYSVATLS